MFDRDVERYHLTACYGRLIKAGFLLSAGRLDAPQIVQAGSTYVVAA